MPAAGEGASGGAAATGGLSKQDLLTFACAMVVLMLVWEYRVTGSLFSTPKTADTVRSSNPADWDDDLTGVHVVGSSSPSSGSGAPGAAAPAGGGAGANAAGAGNGAPAAPAAPAATAAAAAAAPSGGGGSSSSIDELLFGSPSSTSSGFVPVRGVDMYLQEFTSSAAQLWKSSSTAEGIEFRLASHPTFCLSYYSAHVATTPHLYYCDEASQTRFKYDETKKTLSIENGARCLSAKGGKDGLMGFVPCSEAANVQLFKVAANSNSAPIEAEGEGKRMAVTAFTSHLHASAFNGHFLVPNPSPDVYARTNGSLLISSHKDGAMVRISLKRLPGDGQYDAILTSTPCDSAFTSYVESAAPIAMRSGNGFCAGVSFVQLKGKVSGAVLRKGGQTIACAPITPVVEPMVGREDRVYGFANQLSATNPNGNAWDALGGQHEDIFRRMKEDEVRWLPETAKAMEIVKNIKIVFALVCRNVAGSMDPTMAACEEAGKKFKDYRAIILENDSHDGTGQKAMGWAARNKKVYANSQGGLGNAEREVNIANARNRALKVYMQPEYDDFEYITFVDCDFPWGFPPEGVASNFLRDNWAGVCSNGVAGVPPHWYYWDRYAWRDHRWPVGPPDMGWGYLADARLKMLYDPGEDWAPVSLSCFGGLAVYNRSYVKKCDQAYSGKDTKGRTDCEHVPFSGCLIRNGGTLWMNPSFFVRYPMNIYAP